MSFLEEAGALLIHKPKGISSYGVIDLLKKELLETGLATKKTLPKIGHGGTLDPFATGLLVVCWGKAVKLAQYFLGADKSYDGTMLFGETTPSGDPTTPVSERSETIPETIELLRHWAALLCKQTYLQTPPMFSAKKVSGKPLYELARAGIEIERKPKNCVLRSFEITRYESPRADFQLQCSSGTYVRSLVQDFAKLMGSVAVVQELSRTASGPFHLEQAASVELIQETIRSASSFQSLPCWIPFDRLLCDIHRVNLSESEADDLQKGRQAILTQLLHHLRGEDRAALYLKERLVAVARLEPVSTSSSINGWKLEKVF